ncbi:A24 family peptidase [Cupriavidus sp. AU9028]|uniref:prepilin peptidase n=1 Tax=Cupriavidus sp. AU9028 TaxID=2871157 RepID=UPI001C955FE1|nr:A24 family peptidase [Cupriavidus sp. AU9028]
MDGAVEGAGSAGDWTIAALAALPDWFLLTVVAVLGLIVGSFLNVVIHRLPTMIDRMLANDHALLVGEPLPYPERYDLAVPRSACPCCGAPILAWHNIPLIGYLLLRGRCSHCHAPISARYPAVEAASAALALLAAWRFGPSWQALAAMALLWALLALAVIDSRTRLLPDQLTQPLLWLGLLVNAAGLFAPLPDAVIGAAAGYLMLRIAADLFRLVRGKEGMGHGDFKLMGALGAWFGWQALPALIVCASLSGLVYGLANLALRRQHRDTEIPFGPFIAAAGVLVLVAGWERFLLAVGGI